MSTDRGNKEEMEMLLWDYIDGSCSTTSRQHVAQLITENTAWKAAHTQLLALNAAIAQEKSLEQPSMRFTKNVMDTVAQAKVYPAIKSYINYNVIKAIAAFFFLVIGGLFITIFSRVNWQHGYAPAAHKTGIGLQLNELSNPVVMNTFIAIGILLGLLLTDNLLRTKKADA